MINDLDLLVKLINAVNFSFKDDPCVPLLDICIDVDGDYVFSIIRNMGSYRDIKRQAVCQAKNQKPDEALCQLAKDFIVTYSTLPTSETMRALSNLIREKYSTTSDPW